jgi:Xaa-Pro aminopeptidase
MTDAPHAPETENTEVTSSTENVAARGSNRSLRPQSEAFKSFVMSAWAPRSDLGA